VRWPEAKKAEALRIYEEQGAAAASAATGIPMATICSWARRSGKSAVSPERLERVESKRLTWDERRLDVAIGLGEVAQRAVARLLEHLDETSLHETFAVLSTAIDRASVLSGTATGAPVTPERQRMIEEARERAGHLHAVA
jgi:hypothetical protein